MPYVAPADKVTGSTLTPAEFNLLADAVEAAAEALTSTTTTALTAYTLALTDARKVVETTAATAVTLTAPPNSTVAFPIGTVVGLRQYGAGQVTVVPAAGVTIRSRGGALKTAGQYAEAALTKRATDEWVLTGDVTV